MTGRLVHPGRDYSSGLVSRLVVLYIRVEIIAVVLFRDWSACKVYSLRYLDILSLKNSVSLVENKTNSNDDRIPSTTTTTTTTTPTPPPPTTTTTITTPTPPPPPTTTTITTTTNNNNNKYS